MSAAAALAEQPPMQLHISTRQRDMLSAMGLPMQGWPLAEAVADAMPPVRRSLGLGSDSPSDLPPVEQLENISIKSPYLAANTAWVAPKNKVTSSPTRTPEKQPESPNDTALNTLQLWSLDGTAQNALQNTQQTLTQQLLLLVEDSVGAPGFPVTAEALALLRNILAALQWPPEQLLLCALPLASAHAQPASWLAQIGAWQPALALVLGRNASRATLGAQLQAGSLSALRGQTFDVAGVAVRVSYPLDYLLRKPEAKAGAWQDWLAAKWQWDARLKNA